MSLHRIGQDAARMAAVKAYWVDFECLGPEVEREQNAWRISDVVLAAYQLVIAIAGPVDAPDVELPYNLLRAWGNRVWTLSELLLTLGHYDLSIYTINRTFDPQYSAGQVSPQSTQTDNSQKLPPVLGRSRADGTTHRPLRKSRHPNSLRAHHNSLEMPRGPLHHPAPPRRPLLLPHGPPPPKTQRPEKRIRFFSIYPPLLRKQ